MRFSIKKWTIALMIFNVAVIYAQENKLKNADEKYDQLAFIDAREIYLKVAEKGYKSAELLKRLGNSYYFNSNYNEALKWYGELIEGKEYAVEPIYLLRYSQSLLSEGEDEKGKEMFDLFLEKENSKYSGLYTTEDYLGIVEKASGRYTLKNLGVNSSGIDFGTAFFGDKIVFASSRDTGMLKRRSAWDGLPFLDLFSAEINDSDQELLNVEKLKGDINSNLHESSPVFTKDGRTMYFSRNRKVSDKIKNKEKFKRVAIYRATLKDGKWTDIEDLPINSETYSNAHPALGPNGRTLYFVSDRPGTYGLTDIYLCNIDENGKLGVPKNMGNYINTPGRESFPFVTDSNELYFSSDGHFGLGGYDVFHYSLERKSDSKIMGNKLLNVGRPVNGEFDDFAFIIKDNKGFFSSNRSEGKGFDDIYSLVEEKDINDLFKSRISGKVVDGKTKEPIKDAILKLFNEKRSLLGEVKSAEDGTYGFEVDYFSNYIVGADKEDYDSEEQFSEALKEEKEHNFELAKNREEMVIGKDIADILNIKIYFDFDSSTIRPDVETELQKIVGFLEMNPEVNIDVRSYTDSRGNDDYNMMLSNKRVASTMRYVLDSGIDSSRLTGKGYGESRLLNDCSNGQSCTEEEHQENRRSEFIIR